MKTPNPQSSRFTDEDIETLLTEFFRHEMPAELHSAPAGMTDSPAQFRRKESAPRQPVRSSAPAVAEKKVSAAREGRKEAVAGIAVAACALLLAVTALYGPGPSPEGTGNLSSPEKRAAALSTDASNNRQNGGETVTADNHGRPQPTGQPAAQPVELSWPWNLGRVQTDDGSTGDNHRPAWWHQLNLHIVNPLPEKDADGEERHEHRPTPLLPEQRPPKK